MDHGTHAVLILSTAIFLVGCGLVVLALAWRRSYRGERSALVLGQISARQGVLSLVAIPTVGLISVLSIAIAAAALR